MATAYYYDESKNPDGEIFPGVPLADLDDETFDSLPAWLQASVDASPMYRKTPVPTPRKRSADADEKEDS